jgi:hypothetical protein
MKPLCIIDLEHVRHNKEIQSFIQFLPQTGVLQ